MRILDKSTWNRKEHFDFFSQCDEPFFGIVTEINCTKAYQIAKSRNHSFFAYYLHKSLSAINLVEELRYRVDGENINVYNEIHASPTLGREDHTFGFSFVHFDLDFDIFNISLQTEIKNVQKSTGLRLIEGDTRKDVVHYSSIPWHTFSGLTHARNFKFEDSAPKISFGKMFTKKDQQYMNVAINVHHGLADGYHIAQHLEYFQKLMDGELL